MRSHTAVQPSTQESGPAGHQNGCSAALLRVRKHPVQDLIRNTDASTPPTLENEQEAFRLVNAYVVGLPGLEPGTSSLSGMRSNRLSYRPGVLLHLVSGVVAPAVPGNVAQGVGEHHSRKVRLWPRNSAMTVVSERRTVTS